VNGKAQGTLTSVTVDEDGQLKATYSNQDTELLGAVAIASFRDPQSLTRRYRSRKFVAWPPLRRKTDQEALWKAIADGEIQTYATDHCTWTVEQKTDPALDFAGVPGGVSNVESLVGMLFSDGVRTGRFRSHFGCRVPSEVAQTVSVTFAVA